MHTWKRAATALMALSLVALMAVTTASAAPPGVPVAVSGQEQNGTVVLTWLPPETSPVIINQTGCDSMNMSMSYVYSNFTTLYPNITVVLRGGGNDLGFAQWIAGRSDVDQASRAISATEMQEARAKGINVTDTKMGVESVAIIADPRAGVTELSFEQLRGLFSGSIANWKEVGGNDLAVKVFMPSAEGSPYLFINKTVMGTSAFAPSATTVSDGRALAGMVANTSGAVGFVRAGFVNSTAGVQCLAVKSAPNAQAFLGNDTAAAYNGSYVLSRYYRLYTNGTIRGAQAVWAMFILDPEHGQRILADNGFLPLQAEDRANSTKNIDLASTVVSYRIVRQSSDGSAESFDVNTTSYVDSNVTSGRTYTYTVSAVSSTGQETSASPLAVIVPPADTSGSPDQLSPSVYLLLAVVGVCAAAAVVALMLSKRRR